MKRSVRILEYSADGLYSVRQGVQDSEWPGVVRIGKDEWFLAPETGASVMSWRFRPYVAYVGQLGSLHAMPNDGPRSFFVRRIFGRKRASVAVEGSGMLLGTEPAAPLEQTKSKLEELAYQHGVRNVHKWRRNQNRFAAVENLLALAVILGVLILAGFFAPTIMDNLEERNDRKAAEEAVAPEPGAKETGQRLHLVDRRRGGLGRVRRRSRLGCPRESIEIDGDRRGLAAARLAGRRTGTGRRRGARRRPRHLHAVGAADRNRSAGPQRPVDRAHGVRAGRPAAGGTAGPRRAADRAGDGAQAVGAPAPRGGRAHRGGPGLQGRHRHRSG